MLGFTRVYFHPSDGQVLGVQAYHSRRVPAMRRTDVLMVEAVGDRGARLAELAKAGRLRLRLEDHGLEQQEAGGAWRPVEPLTGEPIVARHDPSGEIIELLQTADPLADACPLSEDEALAIFRDGLQAWHIELTAMED